MAVIVLHNLLDPIQASRFGAWAWMWNLLHQPGVFMVGALPVVVSYPLIPWFAVMALGFSCGPVLRMDAVRRRRVLLTTGVLLTIAFVLVRAANIYGDPSPWSAQTSPIFTVLSFLRTTKYPPSLQFLLMTIGPASIALALLDRVPARAGSVLAVIGRVPFFFYVVHFWTIHVVEAVLAFVRYGPYIPDVPVSSVTVDGRAARALPTGFRAPVVGGLCRVDWGCRRAVPDLPLVRGVEAETA